MIYLVPKGGLCNRMRTITATWSFAREIGQELTIVWFNNIDCNLPINEMFDLPSEIRIIDIPYHPNIHVQAIIKRISKWWFRKKCKLVLIDEDLFEDLGKIKQRVERTEKTYMENCEHWYGDAPDFSIFRLRDEFEQLVEKKREEFGSYSVGVHIRRTDHAVSIAYSGTELFTEIMDREIQLYPEVRFFLATDDEREKRELLKKYGDRIVTCHVELKRDSRKGMKGALIDLFLLASTKKVLGSKKSTFSMTASDIGHIPLVIVEK